MNATLILARTEVIRLWRSKRPLVFTLALPVMLYLIFARQAAHLHANGIAYPAYYMAAMASVGAFAGSFNGNAQRISQERRDGWIRQLWLTALRTSTYLSAKIAASMVTNVPSVVLVFLLGRFYGGVHLPTWQWPAIGAAIWAGALTFTALAIAVGYRFLPTRCSRPGCSSTSS